MPVSVRKSICLASIATAASLMPAFNPALVFRIDCGNTAALAQQNAKPVTQKAEPAATQKPAAVQVKKLDDNSKEVLRPIPAILKNKAESAPAARPLEKTRAEASPDVKVAATGKTAAAAITAKAGTTTVTKSETKVSEQAKKTEAKSGETEKRAEGKNALVSRKTVRTKSAAGGAHFVPPPPPNTPSIFNDTGDFALYNGVPIEMLSRDALKDRAKEISIQYKDACRELEDHSRQKDEKIQRAAEFDGLYKEGVVSRRELEASQKEAAEVNSDIDRLTFKAKELKGVLDRINKRLTQSVVKRNGHKLIN